MQEKQLNGYRLATLTKLSEATISYMFSRQTATLKVLNKVCDALGYEIKITKKKIKNNLDA